MEGAEDAAHAECAEERRSQSTVKGFSAIPAPPCALREIFSSNLGEFFMKRIVLLREEAGS